MSIVLLNSATVLDFSALYIKHFPAMACLNAVAPVPHIDEAELLVSSPMTAINLQLRTVARRIPRYVETAIGKRGAWADVVVAVAGLFDTPLLVRAIVSGKLQWLIYRRTQ